MKSSHKGVSIELNADPLPCCGWWNPPIRPPADRRSSISLAVWYPLTHPYSEQCISPLHHCTLRHSLMHCWTQPDWIQLPINCCGYLLAAWAALTFPMSVVCHCCWHWHLQSLELAILASHRITSHHINNHITHQGQWLITDDWWPMTNVRWPTTDDRLMTNDWQPMTND